MFSMATGSAAEDGASTRACVDVPAGADAACLAGVRGDFLLKSSSAPCELVAEHLPEAAPCRIEDASSKPSVGLHHVADLEFLNHDHAVALGVVVAENVQDVVALPTHLPVQDSDTSFGLLSVLGSFLPATDRTLGAREALQAGFVEAVGGHETPIGVAHEVHNASVDGDHGCRALDGFGYVDLADDARKPLVPIALQRAGLGATIQRMVEDRAEVPEFREADGAAVEAPSLRVRLAEGQRVAASALPSWGSGELGETPLPRSVEFDEKLGADVAWNIGEPRAGSAKLGQFVDLVECGRVAPLSFRARESHQPLLQREVPQEPQCVLPPSNAGDLLDRQVDTVAESLADAHEVNRSIGGATRRQRFLSALKDGVSALETG